MKSTVRNMTEGGTTRRILGFAVPMFLGLLLQQLYNMADAFIVGRYLGVQSLAAVGSVSSINTMIIGFCTGVCNGFSIPAAQEFGSEDYPALRKCVANSIWLSAALSLVMTVGVCLLCRPILEAMCTPPDIIDEAYRYIFVIFLGIPLVYLYNLLSGVIRSLGDSKTPVLFLLISALMNIGLDIVFVKWFNTGVEGPAWATVISQGISGLLCLFYIYRRFRILRLSKDEWKLDMPYLFRLFSAGFPMGFQYSVTAVGSVVLQSFVNTLGSAAVAAVTAASKVGVFFCCPFDALGGTMATFAGQNIGAGKPDRIKRGVGAAILIGGIYSLFALAVLSFCGGRIGLLFLDAEEVKDAGIFDWVQQFLTANSLFYFPLAVLNILRFTIQGMGYSGLAVLSGVSEMIARAVMGLFVPVLGYTAVCFANPAAWIMANLILIPLFLYCFRRRERLLAG